MSKIAYLDCPTGIAGDMCLGALVDAGVPLEYLVTQLEQLGLGSEYHLRSEQVKRNGLQGTKVHVELHQAAALIDPATGKVIETTFAHSHQGHSHPHLHSHPGETTAPHLPSHHHHDSAPAVQTASDSQSTPPIRNLSEIEQRIKAANLPDRAKNWSLEVFRRLAAAEAAVHGVAVEQVHFHEVGATDAIVDIVGTCLGLDWLGIEQLYCSALPTGGGTIRAAHGRLPVPTPAVVKLWETHQVPIYNNGIERELVTPTGAAIAVTLATRFGPPPPMTLQRVGLGAGSQNLSLPNLLRLWIGESIERSPAHPVEPLVGVPPKLETPDLEMVTVLETQVDDLNPQAIGYLFDALLTVGALDVFIQPVSMKKSRPGILVTVICLPEIVAACETVLFRETTTLGIRRQQQQRQILQRQIQTVQTAYGSVRVKVAYSNQSQDSPVNVQPEYEDCAQIAQQQHLPWREVHRLALQAWYAQSFS